MKLIKNLKVKISQVFKTKKQVMVNKQLDTVNKGHQFLDYLQSQEIKKITKDYLKSQQKFLKYYKNMIQNWMILS